MQVSVGDKYILHSENGMDYNIKIVNINDFRPDDEKYGADVYDGNGNYAGDVMFFGDDFLQKCEKQLIDSEFERKRNNL